MKYSTPVPLALATFVVSAAAQSSCSSTLTASYPAPSVASGYVAKLVATNFTKPRSVKFDSAGHLLIVQANIGLTALSLTDSGNGCVSEANRTTVLENDALTHGLELSDDGRTLYASSSETLWSWDYDAATQTNTSDPKVLIQNMEGTDHTTRTTLLSRKVPGMVVVCRGSSENIDPLAADIRTTHSQVKAFNLTNATEQGYDYVSDGLMLGWGLRNEVGVAEDPIAGGIWGVENSADELTRSGTDIHQNNPAEELNFLGYLNGTYTTNQGRNFGYPLCFTAYNTSALPSFTGQLGSPFAADSINGNLSSDLAPNDTLCTTTTQPPRLSFQAHTAPLSILFNPNGTAAWITFHGSWNRDSPIGYKLSVVQFDGHGEPTLANTTLNPEKDILTNQDTENCPGSCFRPVGLAWDSQGRLFMSADSTGDIWMITKSDGSRVDGDVDFSGVGSNGTTTAGPSGYPSGSGTPTGSATSTPTSTGGAVGWKESGSGVMTTLLALAFSALAFGL